MTRRENMPVLRQWNHRGVVYTVQSVPMKYLNEEWAQTNHSQTLDGLAERHGLDPREIVCNIKKIRWSDLDLNLEESELFIRRITMINEIAKELNGIQYPCEIPDDLKAKAKENGIVIVYGASDDLMEFEGAIYDEVDCYDGGTALVDKDGLVPIDDYGVDEEDLAQFYQRKKDASKIEALWCSKESPASWSYKTEIPHEIFDVMEDGELFCLGMVFDLKCIS